jgi:hypothetical protein
MAFWNKFPYTNFHDLNLDWVLKIVKENKNNIADIISGDIVVGKAMADSEGNIIIDTYATKTELTDLITGLQDGTFIVARATGDKNGNDITTTYTTKTETTELQTGIENGTIIAGKATKATQDGNGNVISSTYETASHATSEYDRLDSRIDNIPSGGGSADLFDMSNVFVLADDCLNFSYPTIANNWYTSLLQAFSGSTATWDYRIQSGIGFSALNSANQNLNQYITTTLNTEISSDKKTNTKTVILAMGMNDKNGDNVVTNAQSALSSLISMFPNAKIVFFPSITWKRVINEMIDVINVFQNNTKSYVASLAYTWLGLNPDCYSTTDSTEYLTVSGNDVVYMNMYHFLKTGDSNYCKHLTMTDTNQSIPGQTVQADWFLNNGIITLKISRTCTGSFPLSSTRITPVTLPITDPIKGTFVQLTTKLSTNYYMILDYVIYKSPSNNTQYIEAYDRADIPIEGDQNVTSVYSGYIYPNQTVNFVVSFSYPLSSDIT